MLDLVKFIVSQIVDYPDDINLTEELDQSNTRFISLTVNPLDMGKVIGKGGKIIGAIRELVKVKAIKQGQRVRLVLLDQPTQTDPSSPSEPPEPLPQKS